MMNSLLLKLSDEKMYSREELLRIYRKEYNNLNESTFRWTLFNMLQKQQLFHYGYDSYVTVKPDALPAYKPYYSDRAVSLIRALDNKYPNLSFVVFESILLNEFLNHQIAQNTIYVQVEKDVSAYIFDCLRDAYPDTVILYKPSKKEFEKYWVKNCIVVLDLISQCPVSKLTPHEVLIEKLMVDMVAEKSISLTFSPSEISSVYKNIKRSFHVDIRKLNRYASR
ncbi:MAG: hypothetical protein J6E46_06690 [Faecalicoccus sp.]|nr:hypothetical protein [Faecalicoccus sp.]